MRTTAFLQKRRRSSASERDQEQDGSNEDKAEPEASQKPMALPSGFVPAALKQEKPENPEQKEELELNRRLPTEAQDFEESEEEQVEGDLPFSEKEVEYSVNLICEELKEPSRYLVMLVCQSIGNLVALELMKKAQLQDNTEQGVLIADNSRRRSPGGIFFQLAKEKLGRIAFNELQREFHKERKRLKRLGEI